MSDQPTNSDAFDDDPLNTLAGEYVLGTLSAAEREEVEQRLPHEPALRTAIETWEARLQPYTGIVAPVTPSSQLWSRIARSLPETSAAATPDPVSDSHAARSMTRPAPTTGQTPWWQRGWQSLTLWRGVSLASVIVAAGLATMLSLGTFDTPAARYMVVLMTPQHTQAGWVVQASSSQDIELIPLGTFEIPPGKTLEFWTKADDWGGPVSLGLIRPGQTTHLTLDDLPPLENNQLFELTLEDAGGSPVDRPTGPIQFIGRAVTL